MSKKAIIIGASSGIGEALTKLLLSKNYKLGTVARRENKLAHFSILYPDQIIYDAYDITKANNLERLNNIAAKLQQIDLFIICAGFGDLNFELDLKLEQNTNLINVRAFTEIVNWSYKYFENQKFGHLVVISSIAGLRGGKSSPAYNASKAYQINYIEGLSQKNQNKNIHITDIRPGFVDTAMAKGEGLFWVVSVEKAVKQIFRAINNKNKVAYISKRWTLIAFILKITPKSIYLKI